MSGRGELGRLYAAQRAAIGARLAEFRCLWAEAGETEIFAELAFCLLTPQSKARTCWAAVERLVEKGLIMGAPPGVMAGHLTGVRFHNNKARFIAEARETFSSNGKISIRPRLGRLGNSFGMREWLVENVKGLGYKEAGHFLRNIGLGEDLAILDRHILRNLKALGVIGAVPRALSRRRYLDIERRMLEFCKRVGIPPAHLDLLLWAKETGEIFK